VVLYGRLVISLETYKYKDSTPYSDHTGAEYLRVDDDAASANWGGNSVN